MPDLIGSKKWNDITAAIRILEGLNILQILYNAHFAKSGLLGLQQAPAAELFCLKL